MTNELAEKLSEMSMEEVAAIVANMFNDTRDEAGVVLDAALAALETKMPEADFVRFCAKFSA